MTSTLYLDNAATTYPKPKAVLDAVQQSLICAGGNPGRSGHRLALAAQRIVYDCRCTLAEFFGTDAPERVVFTYNTTYALNLAIKSMVRPGDHLLISNLEHNSVYRPVHKLARSGICTYDVFSAYTPGLSPLRQKQATLADIAAKITPATRGIVCTHASNLCGVTLPLSEIGALCRRHGLYFIVDAAQSAGILPIDPDGWGIDALCLPGHKGLYGIMGCGAVLFSAAMAERSERLATVTEGGSGVYSLESEMPPLLPERMEAGTPGVPAIAALTQGIRFLQQRGLGEIAAREFTLGEKLKERLFSLPGYRIYAPEWGGGVVSFTPPGGEVNALCETLDRFGICVRGGFHCAPLAHQALQSGENGAVRISVGAFNTQKDMDRVFGVLQKNAF